MATSFKTRLKIYCLQELTFLLLNLFSIWLHSTPIFCMFICAHTQFYSSKNHCYMSKYVLFSVAAHLLPFSSELSLLNLSSVNSAALIPFFLSCIQVQLVLNRGVHKPQNQLLYLMTMFCMRSCLKSHTQGGFTFYLIVENMLFSWHCVLYLI